ncbi:hypothetical protein [Streptomyces sp. LN549]|uniref:hypothetical protein n=1 Tax=Streptomyces sp. LN549 TaxID=3112979 RepID=UPI00371ABE13
MSSSSEVKTPTRPRCRPARAVAVQAGGPEQANRLECPGPHLAPDLLCRPGNRLRSLDALHLAAAQGLGRALLSFVVYDKRLIESARELDLPVARPGAG